VISLVSAAPTERRWRLGGDMGSDGLWQARAGVEAPLDGGFSLRASASHFEIDGLRPQSRARRTLGNVRLGWDLPQDRVVVVLNSIDQPALDPLGLSRAQLEELGFDATTPQALAFDTRKTARQDQAGASWLHRFADAGALRESRLAAYVGQRSVTQWQSIPPGTPPGGQFAPTSPGGVIDFDREYAGLDGRLVWRWALAGERSAQLVAGTSLDQSREDRRGYQNFIDTDDGRVLGVTGALRRDERNRVATRDVYAQAEVDLARDWTATLGVRHGRVDFRSEDRFLDNGDDSGSRSLRYTNPVAALQWRATPALNLYVSTARGFESPTLNELFYRPDALTGFNTALDAQTSRQWEAGLKWRDPARAAAFDAAVFDIRTDDEIGVASSSGGRTTFRNVGRTRRYGAELDLRWRVADAWRAQLAASWLDATYRDTLPSTPIVAGRRIAGTLDAWGYAELAWLPVTGTELALEGRAQSDVPVDDANSDFAEGFGLLALRARWQRELGAGRLELLARVDNLTGRRVVGSVIVNESNQRFFEPAPGRTWLIAARWSAPF
jgi:iron complex outermembrane receptor protein